MYPAQSATAGHTQAMFVYGLMLPRESRACEAAPSMRRAAEAGLNSPRLAYVDNALSGRWSDCGVVLDADLMAAFVDAAADRVSAYYENMLLRALLRELTSLTSP